MTTEPKSVEELAKDIAIVAYPDTRDLVERRAITVLTTERARVEEERDKSLANWVLNHVGVSSKAIFAYMVLGEVPKPWCCPSDDSDRGRCVELLRARPEWIERLSEIENVYIDGTRNGKKATQWNEQIPLIREALTPNQE